MYEQAYLIKGALYGYIIVLFQNEAKAGLSTPR
jgi:hypothetical protein